MIGKLTGQVDSIAGDHAIIDVGGVGYVVFASGKTLARLGNRGSAASLLIDTHVREDAISLYGFADATERDWFRALLNVQGVGARVALSILSVLAPDELARAVAAQDKAAVARANGVGPKLAQRVVAEMKDKVGGISLGISAPVAGAAPAAADGPMNDAVSALVNLGYRRAEAYGAVTRVMQKQGADAALNDLIVHGLKELAQ
ncbi:Holliday junction DNA helicase subunit RuvA [Dongia mobilis]|uniref:Holliday junction branch migration complex subunit RuvA n=1 Tax=Dongia mobilis TaxID=578943 RepID=A0A4R6WD78_9PROT|nr:Holliday junction branch migration protein RuvA [Dongia mobilis]TDQ77636.1 Holliday junction DNA helicase subunit RuvA [Dongia mobilis]